jgi:hypothetical protein
MGGIVDSIFGGGDAPPAPDYAPVAAASEESARIGAAQADRVLAESTRQYDRNMAVAQPVIDAQLGMMKSAQQQGDDYYDYWKTNAPQVERALKDASLKDTSAADAAERGLITGGDADIYNARKGDIDAGVNNAIADSQGGYTRALNQGYRQARRYGMAPVATTGTMAVQQAANTAGAGNAARTAGIDRSRGLLKTGRDMRIQDEGISTAKKLDVAGLYRGMPGASTGAYSSANQSGNSAVNNSTTVGNGMVAGTGTAGQLTMQGQGMKVQGLGNVLSAQSSYANANQGGTDLGGLGSLVGAGVKLGSAMKWFPV